MKRSQLPQCIAVVLFLLLVLTPGVSQAATPSSDMLVSTAWLVEHEKDANLVLLHMGLDRKIYDVGHIAGARFVPMSAVSVTCNEIPNQVPAIEDIQKALESAGISDDSFVVAYGDGPLLAAHVYFLLDYIGHPRHAVLDGGIHTWKFEKRPLTTAVAEFKPGKLTVKAHPELLVDFDAVQKMVAEKKTLLIDSRPPDQYSGAKPGEGMKRGGHIPGAKNVFWIDTLASTTNPVLKPVASLRALYEVVGAKTGDDIVAYCRSGPMATHTYFTLKLAGFRPVVYFGSFMEWGNAANTEVETGKGI